MRRRPVVLAGAGLAVVVGAGAVLSWSQPTTAGSDGATPTNVSTAAVERKTLDAATQVDGSLGYAASYDASDTFPYTLTNALTTRGGADATSLLASYAQAQAGYDTAVQSLAALEHPAATSVAQAQAQLASARATLTSAQQSARGPSAKELDSARAQLAQARAGLTQAEQGAQGPTAAQVAAAQAQLAQAQANLLRAQDQAQGPTAAQTAQAQAQVTQAQSALTADQAAHSAAVAAYAACAANASPSPSASGSPAPTASPTTPCDLASLQLAVQQAAARLSTDQANLTAAEAALAGLSSAQTLQEAQAAVTSAQQQVASAQAALDALTSAQAQAQAQAQLTAAQAAATAAQAALASITSSETKAQARSQLAAVEAQVHAAQTALDALLHPTSAQITQAKDQVSTARTQLAAAKARLDAPSGVATQLAAVGSTVQPGGVLYTLDGTIPVVLMAGDTPAWRTLQAGVSDGPDVKQLEEDLQTLGFASASLQVDDHWDAETTAAVKRWQDALGVAATGVVQYGEVVFEPGALRVTAHTAALGATVQAGAAVLQATTTRRVVTVALDPALQTNVKQGDAVSVVLPDSSTTPGHVSNVGTVATASSGSGNPGSSSPPTINVEITLDDPAAAGDLDQAPVTVNITTATATNVLAVPVSALVALLEGGYAVQVDDNGQLHYVGVQLGLFASGWVQVTGSGLAEGQKVVVTQ